MCHPIAQFQSTLSSRRATPFPPGSLWPWRNFNPRSPHGERPRSGRLLHRIARISIHALLTESDCAHSSNSQDQRYFNPRSPHGERPFSFSPVTFESNFNPRSPHGERRLVRHCRPTTRAISIHALLTESDRVPDFCFYGLQISIHALLTESDCPQVLFVPCPCNFNPRSPHGERRRSPSFLSRRRQNFNPRSPHGERHSLGTMPLWFNDFNPRSPHGERQTGDLHTVSDKHISIHALLTESDQTIAGRRLPLRYFNPRSPHGERHCY